MPLFSTVAEGLRTSFKSRPIRGLDLELYRQAESAWQRGLLKHGKPLQQLVQLFLQPRWNRWLQLVGRAAAAACR